MKKLLFSLCALLMAAPFASAQTAAVKEFEIKKVLIAMIDTPIFQYSGPPQKQHRPAKWLEVEVDFDAKPEFTDELSFNYYVFLNKRLFVGTVVHVSIEKGNGLHTVMYISPKTLARITGGKNLNVTEVVATVQIAKPGIQMAVSEKSSKVVQPNWWASLKQETGFLTNKNETPFAPLYWDYYEAIKPSMPR